MATSTSRIESSIAAVRTVLPVATMPTGVLVWPGPVTGEAMPALDQVQIRPSWDAETIVELAESRARAVTPR